MTTTIEVPAPTTVAAVSSTAGPDGLVFPLAPLAGLLPFWLSVAAAVVSFGVAGAAFAAEFLGLHLADTARRPLRAVRSVAVVIGVAAALAGGAYALIRVANAPPAAAAGAENPVAADAASIQRGGQAYAANCAACHGAASEFGARIAGTSDGSVYYAVTNGVTGTAMPAFGGVLTEVERWDVVNYLRDGSGR